MKRYRVAIGNKADTWSQIAERFEGLPDASFAPLKQFVRELIQSPFPAAGLKGLVSMHTILLGVNELIRDEPRLVIEFDFDKKEFVFEYPGPNFDTLEHRPRWTRRVPPEKAFSVLEHFLIKRVRWFRDHRPAKA